MVNTCVVWKGFPAFPAHLRMMVWGLPRCVWARESTAPAQGNQSLSSGRGIWAVRRPARAGLGSGPVQAEALGQHGGLQVLVLLLLPQPLLLQQGYQGVSLLHHLQHLVQDPLLLRQLLLRLQVV